MAEPCDAAPSHSLSSHLCDGFQIAGPQDRPIRWGMTETVFQKNSTEGQCKNSEQLPLVQAVGGVSCVSPSFLCSLVLPAFPTLPTPPVTLQTPVLVPITTLPQPIPLLSLPASSSIAPELLCFVCSTSKTNHLFHYANKLPLFFSSAFPVLPYSHTGFSVPRGLGFLFFETCGSCLWDHREQPVNQHSEFSAFPSPDGSLQRLSPPFTQGLHNFIANKVYPEALWFWLSYEFSQEHYYF